MSLEYLIWTQVLSMIFGFSKGTISIIAGNSYLIKGEPASLICEVNPLEAPVTWKTSAFQTGGLDDTQTTCFPAGNCIPSNSGDDARYSFSSSIGSGQFNGTMSISTVVCPTDSATYTCEHGNAANEKTSRQLTVQVIPSTVGITESGLTITAKTDCLAEPSALQRQWYKVYANGTNEEYTPPNLQASYDDSGCPTDGCGTTEVISSFVHINPSKGPIVEVTFKVKVWHSAEPSSTFDAETVQKYQFQGPECCCCCICCFIVLIVCVALGLVFCGGHIGLTWTNHEHSVKKRLFFENNETEKTNEAVYLKDYAMKVVVPECCICVLVIIIQIAVYFAALKRDCNEDCDDDCCGAVVCLVVTIIVSIVKNAIESGIIFFVVHVKGKNYTDQGGDQHLPDGKQQRPQRGDADKHKSGEPKSNTTKTDEAGSFVSGKDVKVDTGGSSSWRAQPPLPEIKSDKKNTRGLSANIDDSDINPSNEKKRLTPIGQEAQLGWEEKSDRSEEVKEKKKKRKSKDKDREKDSNITESVNL